MQLTSWFRVLSVAIEQSLTQLRHDFASFQVDENRDKIIRWLACADPSLNHHVARKKHEPTTGDWLIKDNRYGKWKAASNSVLWLHGIRKMNNFSL